MLRDLRVYARLMRLALALCVALNVPLPAFPQDAPPPQDAPSTQPQVKDEPPQPPGEKPDAGQVETAPVEEGQENPPIPARAGATLKGRVAASDRRTPLVGARVHAIAQDGRVFTSPPVDGKGRYLLSGLSPATYHLAVSTEAGVFSLETEVGISSASLYTVDLATVPAEAARGTVPGLELDPVGFATIVQGKKKGGGASFWGSAKGITLLAVSAGAVALILSRSADEEQPAVSPSLP